MKAKKMSLANIQGKLSRTEMKNIMAGSGGCSTNACTVYTGSSTYSGTCGYYNLGGGLFACECVTAYGFYNPSGGTSHCVN